MKKIILINGSPNKNGSTKRALEEVVKGLDQGITSEIIDLSGLHVKDCIGCYACKQNQNVAKCAIDDIVNELIDKMREAQGLIVGSPVFFAGPTGNLLSLLHRLFYASLNDKKVFSGKIGASVAIARRAGTSSTLDCLNKFFQISNMYIAGSSYWPLAHSQQMPDIEKDIEGLNTLENLGRSMSHFILNMEKSDLDLITPTRTNFIK